MTAFEFERNSASNITKVTGPHREARRAVKVNPFTGMMDRATRYAEDKLLRDEYARAHCRIIMSAGKWMVPENER